MESNAAPTHPVVETPDFSNVRTFILFVGYPRSGHSLIGSIMDAHPNIIIAHEVQQAATPALASTISFSLSPSLVLYSLWPFGLFALQYDVVGKLESYMSDDGRERLYTDLFQDSKGMAFREGGRQHNNYKYKTTRSILSSDTSTCTDTAVYVRLCPSPHTATRSRASGRAPIATGWRSSVTRREAPPLPFSPGSLRSSIGCATS
jgi:hypothetical protein